jgi:hypothetical protein
VKTGIAIKERIISRIEIGEILEEMVAWITSLIYMRIMMAKVFEEFFVGIIADMGGNITAQEDDSSESRIETMRDCNKVCTFFFILCIKD